MSFEKKFKCDWESKYPEEVQTKMLKLQLEGKR